MLHVCFPSIHSNLRSVVYCHAVAVGGEKEWEFTWNKFQNANDTFEKEQLRRALSCTTKIWLLNRWRHRFRLKSEHKDLIRIRYYSSRPCLSLSYSVPLLSRRYLEYTLDPEKIRLMDVAFTVASVASNVAGHALAWNFIRANWEYVQNG